MLSTPKSITISLVVAGATLATAQSIPPTQAWHRPIPGGSYAIDSGGIVNDASGYGYAFYADGPPNLNTQRIGHVLKVGPTNNTVWRADIQPPAGIYKPYQILISPKIGSQQFVYAVGTLLDAGTSQNNVFIKKYDTNGTDLYPTGALLTNYDITPIGAGVATNGDLLIAGRIAAGVSGYVRLYRVHADSSHDEQPNTTITPTSAIYDPTSDYWFISGFDSADPLHAEWGAYTSVFGSYRYGEGSEGSNVGNNTIAYSYVLNFIPNGQILAALNIANTDNIAHTTAHSYQLDAFDIAHGTQNWTHPAGDSQTSGEMFVQAVAYKVDGPMWVETIQDNPTFGFPAQHLQEWDTLGTPLGDRAQQPVQQLFAAPDGFYDLFWWSFETTSFLEHFDGGAFTSPFVFNWGKAYAGTGPIEYNNALSQFQNCFWVAITGAGSSGNDLYIDRFVNGTALQSITAPASFTAGNTLTVTINLNRAVQTGENVTVALNSLDSRVKLPNGQQGQNFIIPVGQSAFNVDLSTTAGTYTVNLLAIQNGIRRTTSSNGS